MSESTQGPSEGVDDLEGPADGGASGVPGIQDGGADGGADAVPRARPTVAPAACRGPGRWRGRWCRRRRRRWRRRAGRRRRQRRARQSRTVARTAGRRRRRRWRRLRSLSRFSALIALDNFESGGFGPAAGPSALSPADLGRVRRSSPRLLGSAGTALDRRHAAAGLHRPARRTGRRRAGRAPGSADAVPPGREERLDPRQSRLHRSGGVGATIDDQVSDDKLVRLVRRRLDHGAAGPAPRLAADHRLLPAIWRPNSAIRSRPTRTSLRRRTRASATTTTSTTCSCCRSPARRSGRSTPRCIRRRCAISRGPTGAPPSSGEPREPPLIQTVLRPGDCLYLPRGFLHAARARGGVSTHLTLGVHTWTR